MLKGIKQRNKNNAQMSKGLRKKLSATTNSGSVNYCFLTQFSLFGMGT